MLRTDGDGGTQEEDPEGVAVDLAAKRFREIEN